MSIDLDVLEGLAKGISPVTRLTKSFANQKTNGTHMVDLVDRVNFHVIAATVYEPYADHILAAVNALPDLIAAARERDGLREALTEVRKHLDGDLGDKDWIETERLVRQSLSPNAGEPK